MEKLVSIIVPVYNVEKYLARCVETIMAQTYQNIEIILVDDGSKDNSGKMCDEFASQDSRIKVIHKENGGISDVRNQGMKVATGDYIGFVDSDDYIAEDMFETLVNLLEENDADISIVSFYEYYNGILLGVRKNEEKEIMSKTEAIKELLIDRKIQSYTWNKLFKRELFDGLQFPTGKNFEDIATLLLIFERANKVVLWENPKYYYLRRDDSIVGVRNTKTYTDYLEVIYDKYLYLKDKYPEIEIYNEHNYIINMIWVYTIISAFDLDDVYKKFKADNYALFEELINKHEKELTELLDYYNKSVLYLMLLNVDASKEATKTLYKTYKEKRNNGEFSLQI
ncbi:MAG: glycosyltransferase family 2 protein [Clostridia bacterium]|nr:glycosyltransferase family 2 protein [Clostridia bacterium]